MLKLSTRPLVYTISVLLPAAYLIGLIFTLKTHSHIYDIHISGQTGHAHGQYDQARTGTDEASTAHPLAAKLSVDNKMVELGMWEWLEMCKLLTGHVFCTRLSCGSLVPVEGSDSADCSYSFDGLLCWPQHRKHRTLSDLLHLPGMFKIVCVVVFVETLKPGIHFEQIDFQRTYCVLCWWYSFNLRSISLV